MKSAHQIFFLFALTYLFFASTSLLAQNRVGDPGVSFNQSIINANKSCYPQMERWSKAGVTGGIPFIASFDKKKTISPGNTNKINDAINEMSNSLSGNQKGLITLSNGNYSINSSVKMKSNVSLIGESRDGVKCIISMTGGEGFTFRGVTFAGLYNLTIEGGWGKPKYNWNYSLNANNELPNNDNISIKMSGSTKNCWVDKVNIINCARDPIRVVAEHVTLRDLYVDGAHKKAGGAQGYFFIQSRDNLITGCYVTHLRHISLQGGNVEYNVVYDNNFEQEVSFHSGDNGNNLIANNKITLPVDMPPVARGDADDVTPPEARNNKPTYFAIMGPWSRQHSTSKKPNYLINNICKQFNHNLGPSTPWSEPKKVYKGPLRVGSQPSHHINNFPFASQNCVNPVGGELYPILLSCVQGASCDDGDPCTINDILDSDCNCEGEATQDDDNDGVCNTIDQCPDFDDKLIGTPCDDGEVCTINDVYTSDCICKGSANNTIEVLPIEDAYIQNTTSLNNEFLRIENGNRVSYLKFDISNITDIESVSFRVTVESDSGSGNLDVHMSNDVSWSETTLSPNNAPSQDNLVGSFSGNYNEGESYSVKLDNAIKNTNAPFSLILSQQPGGNDVAFGSSEFQKVSSRPKLLVTRTGCNLSTNDDEFSNSIVLYPNPMKDHLIIKRKGGNDSSLIDINLYDVLGKQLIEIKNNNSETVKLNTANFSSGIYFVELINKNTNSVVIKKILK